MIYHKPQFFSRFVGASESFLWAYDSESQMTYKHARKGIYPETTFIGQICRIKMKIILPNTSITNLRERS